MVALAALITLGLLVIFFASPLRQRIEDKLFDIRTRLSPLSLAEPLPLIVFVDDSSLAHLGLADLDAQEAARIASKLLLSGATSVTLLLHPQVFSYEDPSLTLLTDMAAQDPRLFLAIFDTERSGRGADTLPPLLRPVASQVISASLKRDFRRSIVRRIELPSSGKGGIEHVIRVLAAQLRPHPKMSSSTLEQQVDDIHTPSHFRVNYPNLKDLPHISLSDALGQSTIKDATNRPVIVGYSAYRPTRENQFDATLVNSPWQEEGHDVEKGTPFADVVAAASVNVAQDTYLRDAPFSAQMVQIVLMSAAAFGAWHFSSSAASLLFLCSWVFLLGLHALLFAWASLYIPLADTALFSTVAMTLGALLRIRTDGRLRASQEAWVLTQTTVASVQERFLDVFASELTRMNHAIHSLLQTSPLKEDRSQKFFDAHQRALQSCEELQDYLQGIENFARFRSKSRIRPKLIPVELGSVTEQTLKQFESRQRESETRVVLDIDRSLTVLGDPTLMGQILYNLISNALKYSPPRSTVQILAVKNVDSIDLHVIDQGPGIAQEHQKLIFEKFYRIKNDLSYKVKGHGLGLYLSHYFANLMDAAITVHSHPGEGATFIFRLKASKPDKTHATRRWRKT